MRSMRDGTYSSLSHLGYDILALMRNIALHIVRWFHTPQTFWLGDLWLLRSNE